MPYTLCHHMVGMIFVFIKFDVVGIHMFLGGGNRGMRSLRCRGCPWLGLYRGHYNINITQQNRYMISIIIFRWLVVVGIGGGG